MKLFYYAFQSIIRGKRSSIIKIISLSLGLLVGILLFTQLAFELSFESSYPDAKKLGLVRCQISLNGIPEPGYDNTSFYPMSQALIEHFPNEIENATSIFLSSDINTLYRGNKKLNDCQVAYVDTMYVPTMGITIIKGDPKELATPGSAFISASLSKETFGEQDPIGETLRLNREMEVTVRGIYKDLPKNTHFYHDLMVSVYNGEHVIGWGSWNSNDQYFVITRLHQYSDFEVLNQNIDRMVEKYKKNEGGWSSKYNIVPLTKYYIDYSEIKMRIIILSLLGTIIFGVATLNYILISVSGINRRAKMVGVHKCNGAGMCNIFSMFLLETGILIIISLFVCIFLMLNFTEQIEDLLSSRLDSVFTWQTLWMPVLIIGILLLVSGALPAWLFSRISVTQVFHSYTENKRKWKTALLFMQYICISFMIGLLLVIMLQYRHLLNKDIGFNPIGLVSAEMTTSDMAIDPIFDNLRQQPEIESISKSCAEILWEYYTRGLINNSGKRIATLNVMFCDYSYPKTVGLTLVSGRMPAAEDEIIVNEELVRMMEWTDGALGKKLEGLSGSIIGVVSNVRNKSFCISQTPIAYIGKRDAGTCLNVRLKPPYDENLRRLNEYVANTFPTSSLKFNSVEQMIKQSYNDISRFQNWVSITVAFILIIVLIGLIGYVSDEIQRRTKEIAIRKVNGAKAGNILKLIVNEILYSAIPAVLLGVTISYFIGQIWLERFPERIYPGVLEFGSVVLSILIFITICVVLKAWHIANENPVNNLKSE